MHKISIIALLISGFCFGLQYYPEETLGRDPNDISFILSGTDGFTPHPADEALVAIEWPRSVNWFATATVIAPNYILTVGHWRTVLKSDYPAWPMKYKLKRLGRQKLANEYVITDYREDVSRDILVCRIKKANPVDPNILEDANFSTCMTLYSGNDEVGKTTVIGCYGKIEKNRKPWGECTPEERKTMIRSVRIAGTLHWGRNVIRLADWLSGKMPIVAFIYDSPGTGDALRLETCGTEGSSGSPWFIQDAAGNWSLAGMFTSGTMGPRISKNRDIIADLIDQMNKVSK